MLWIVSHARTAFLMIGIPDDRHSRFDDSLLTGYAIDNQLIQSMLLLIREGMMSEG